MKKCPQCNTVYEDDIDYCLNDGTELAEEIFMLPTDDSIEAETIIRHDPIIVNLSDQTDETPIISEYEMPNGEKVIVVPAETPDKTRNYALFLMLGLLIGGGLVLATILFTRNNETENANVTHINVNLAANGKPAPTAKSTVEISAANQTLTTAPTNDKHSIPTNADDNSLNGRVIALNARVRSAPSLNGTVADTLPLGDRLNIVRRENPNSPWYQVECEHGTSGWMHGDTIEYTR